MSCFVCGDGNVELIKFEGREVCLGCWNYAVPKMIELRERVLELEEEIRKLKANVRTKPKASSNKNE